MVKSWWAIAIAYSQLMMMILRNVSFTPACKRLSVLGRSLFCHVCKRKLPC
ncbi:hypothetical protein [Nostoc sp.]|uniref:hypothetical protein n=1 Tax=Nostoc sp. TaxID=1180 RepID=UPI002FFCB5C6